MTENSRSKKKHKNPQNHQQNELPFSCPLIHSQKKKRTTISILSQWSGKRCLSPFLFRLFFFCSFSLTFPQPLSLFSQRRPAATHDRWIYYILSLVSLGFSLSHLMLLFYFYFFFCRFSSNCNGFYPFTLLGERCPFSRGKFFFFVFFFVFLFEKHNTRPDVGVKLLFAMFYGYFSHLEGMCQHSFCSAVKWCLLQLESLSCSDHNHNKQRVGSV